MPSRDQACQKSDVQEGRIVKSVRRVNVAHQSTCNKDSFFRGETVIAVDFSSFDCLSEKEYGEPLDEPIFVCGFEKALSAGLLIDFGDPTRPVTDCIEQLSTRQLIHSRMVLLYFVTKFLTALVTGQEVPAGAQLPCLPDEKSKDESLLSYF